MPSDHNNPDTQRGRLRSSLARRTLAAMVLSVLLPLVLLVTVVGASAASRIAVTQANLATQFAHTGFDFGCDASVPSWSRNLGPRIDVYAYDGQQLTSSNATAPALSEAIKTALSQGEAAAAETSVFRLGGGLFALRLKPAGSCGVVAVKWGVPDQFARWAWLLAALLAAAVLAATLGVVWVVSPLLKRLDRLSVLATRVGQGIHLEPADPLGDEVGVIDSALRSASAQIERDQQQLKDRHQSLERFLLELGHDLKTPLAALTLSMDELCRAPGAPVDASRSAWAELVYVEQLVENLRFELRLKTSAEDRASPPFELAELIENTVARLRPLAEKASVSLEYALPPEPAYVTAERTLFERGLSNLVHNAVSHGAHHVAVHLTVYASSFLLCIDDDGPGFSHSPSPRRGDGLGRSIAQSAFSVTPLQLTTEPLPEGGLRAAIRGVCSPSPGTGEVAPLTATTKSHSTVK
jgi:signal transduction histidine kinase